ncbi:MAG: ATP-binding protein [Gemmatimonadaceae bacterium]
MDRLKRRKSLSRRLPLLISGLLIAALVAFGFVGYRQLTSALMAAARDRVQSTSQLLARTFEGSVPQLRAELTRIGSDSAVKRLLLANDENARKAVQRTFADRITLNTQAIGLELRDRNGKRVLWVDGPATAKLPRDRKTPLTSTPASGSLVGPIVSDRGTLFYEATVPILRSPTDTIGTLTQHRLVSSGQSAQLIGGLIGSDATLLVGNSGGIWTDFSKVVDGPSANPKGSPPASYLASDGSARLGASALIKATPWVVWVDVRESTILAPARRFLGGMALAGLLILIAGAVGAWLISRQITTPLHEIALATEGISAGDYTRRVIISREDELGTFANSFNRMAHEIEESRHKIEGRVAARTQELQAALGELREAQETLVRKERLAMLGLLAGGVGHELRNPLGVMTNAIYYLGAVLKDSPREIADYLGILRTQITLAEKIVGDLLDFARIKPPQFALVSVQQLVNEQLERAGPLNGVEIKHDFPADLPDVRVDSVQIGQVVLNLITNALQAMNGHGAKLTFRGRRGGNGFVRLDVIDTGIGMKPNEMAKLFEPLFTTKARGIGLGLAVSQGLVHANGGVISAESTPGVGTTISVSLPTAEYNAA